MRLGRDEARRGHPRERVAACRLLPRLKELYAEPAASSKLSCRQPLSNRLEVHESHVSRSHDTHAQDRVKDGA